jgi:hypothetical protein
MVLHRRAGPLQGAVGRRHAGLKQRGRLVRRPAQDITQDERGALAWRQDLERR